MGSQISYELKVQEVDVNNLIGKQADVEVNIQLPTNKSGDETPLLAAGCVDTPIHLIDSAIDLLILMPAGEVTVKLNSNTGTPETIRAGGIKVLDGKGITALYASNAAVSPVSMRVIQAVR